MGGTILTGDPSLIKAGPRNTRLRMDSQLNKIQGIPNQKNKMGRHVEIMGNRRDAYRDFVYNPELKRALGIPRRTWEGNIKTDVK